MVLSASSVSAVLIYDQSPYYFFFRQIVFVLVSYFVGFIIVLRKPIRKYKNYLPFFLIGILGLLIYLIAYGLIVNGARSWIDLGFFSIQPSEFAKTVIILFMGIFYGDYAKKYRKKEDKFQFFIPIAYAIIVFGLVAIQPDLGTAIIIAGITFLTFLAVPFDKTKVMKVLKIVSGAIAVIALVFLVSGADILDNILTDTQKSRLTYKEPCTRYTEETGYQVCNGFIAFNNGGLFGKGLGGSTQKYLYLPEAHTDFIFPIFIEELGLLTGILFIIGYMVIIYRILKIAKESVQLRNSIICYGIAMYILLHIIVNFCGILALIPLTGVPVPFLSYGGSFTMNLIICIFIVERICYENNISRSKVEIKKGLRN